MSANEQGPIREWRREGTIPADQTSEWLTGRSGLENPVSDLTLANFHSVDNRRDLHLWEAIAEIIEIAGKAVGFHKAGWIPKKADIEYLDAVVEDLILDITEGSSKMVKKNKDGLEELTDVPPHRLIRHREQGRP